MQAPAPEISLGMKERRLCLLSTLIEASIIGSPFLKEPHGSGVELQGPPVSPAMERNPVHSRFFLPFQYALTTLAISIFLIFLSPALRNIGQCATCSILLGLSLLSFGV